MSVLFDALKKYLDEDDWKYTEEEGNRIFLSIRCKNAVYKGVFLHRNEKRLDFYFDVPLMIPEEKRNEIGDYIHLVNWGMPLVTLEFNPARGDIRSRTTVLWTEGEVPTGETLDRYIARNYHTVDNYFKGITAILYGGLSPLEAIKMVENTVQENNQVVSAPPSTSTITH